MAEVLSDSKPDKDVELKRQRHVVHPDNLYCLIIDQKQVRIEVWARATGWQCAVFDRPDAILRLPEFGFSAPIINLYRGTPLAWPTGT